MKSLIIFFIIVLIQLSTFAQVNFTSSNLPIVILNTNGQQIIDDPKIMADFKIIYNGEGIRNNISDTNYNYTGKIGIEIRGSTSQMFPKKQYGFETWDSLGNEINTQLLGFPSSDSWILFAPYNDKSLIRDALMYKFSNLAGRYASRTKYCELVLNGEYMGIYVLMEKIKRGKGRVNISKMSDVDITGENVTGGYIFKLDKIDPDERGWSPAFPYKSGTATTFVYEYPKSDNIVAAQETYLKNYVNNFETAVHNDVYGDTLHPYEEYINTESFADFILLNELAKNVDAYRISTYFNKDRNGKINAGPIWDFNLGFGNCDYYNVSTATGWHLEFNGWPNNEGWYPPLFWSKLFNDPYFKNKLALRWKELRSGQLATSQVAFQIDSLTTLLNESKDRNFAKWPVLGQYVWPNFFIGATYVEEVQYLKNWISIRLNWMDTELAKVTGINEYKESIITNYSLHQNYPNPFNPSTKISFSLPEAGFANLKVFNSLGEEVAILVNEFRVVGNHEVVFNAKELSSGLYIYKLQVNGQSFSKKMLLLK